MCIHHVPKIAFNLPTKTLVRCLEELVPEISQGNCWKWHHPSRKKIVPPKVLPKKSVNTVSRISGSPFSPCAPAVLILMHEAICTWPGVLLTPKTNSIGLEHYPNGKWGKASSQFHGLRFQLLWPLRRARSLSGPLEKTLNQINQFIVPILLSALSGCDV